MLAVTNVLSMEPSLLLAEAVNGDQADEDAAAVLSPLEPWVFLNPGCFGRGADTSTSLGGNLWARAWLHEYISISSCGRFTKHGRSNHQWRYLQPTTSTCSPPRSSSIDPPPPDIRPRCRSSLSNKPHILAHCHGT